MSAPLARRGFLRGLTTLPLIGGGVTLIGQPTAVAEPVTDAVMNHYLGFVSREYRDLLIECEGRAAAKHVRDLLAEGQPVRPNYVLDCVSRAEERFSWLEHPWLVNEGRVPGYGPPSARAALVLSAVGCDWRQDRGGQP